VTLSCHRVTKAPVFPTFATRHGLTLASKAANASLASAHFWTHLQGPRALCRAVTQCVASRRWTRTRCTGCGSHADTDTVCGRREPRIVVGYAEGSLGAG